MLLSSPVRTLGQQLGGENTWPVTKSDPFLPPESSPRSARPPPGEGGGGEAAAAAGTPASGRAREETRGRRCTTYLLLGDFSDQDLEEQQKGGEGQGQRRQGEGSSPIPRPDPGGDPYLGGLLAGSVLEKASDEEIKLCRGEGEKGRKHTHVVKARARRGARRPVRQQSRPGTHLPARSSAVCLPPPLLEPLSPDMASGGARLAQAELLGDGALQLKSTLPQ